MPHRRLRCCSLSVPYHRPSPYLHAPHSTSHRQAMTRIQATRSRPAHSPPRLTSLVVRLVADGVEVILGAQDQAIANEGGSGEGHFVEVVGIEQFVFIAGADHERLAFLVHTKNLAVVAPGR